MPTAVPAAPAPPPAAAGPDADLGGGVRARFAAALAAFGRDAPVLVLGHNDADGLAATALFLRAFAAAGWAAEARIVGRGENPWSPELRAELAARELGGLVVADLGTRAGAIRPGVATVIVDHHVPTGVPDGATLITGHGLDPSPTASLLAFWCAGVLADPDPWLWLAALGLVGDMADTLPFPEMAAARRYGITALREAAALVNAPRRAAAGDAAPALALLMAADGPKSVLSGVHPETAVLQAARAEVKAATAAARKIPPTVRGGVALIRLHSPCQVHPLVAQQWRGRLKGEIVIAANTGFRPGWVHFAARSATGVDLIDFLARHRPPGADENYGSGHAGATGGALRLPDWHAFLAGLGFAEAGA